jgi:hypothetical protein
MVDEGDHFILKQMSVQDLVTTRKRVPGSENANEKDADD